MKRFTPHLIFAGISGLLIAGLYWLAPYPTGEVSEHGEAVLYGDYERAALEPFSFLLHFADEPSRPKSDSPTPDSNTPVITAAKYAKIETGMHYAVVATSIGVPGEQQATSDAAGIHTESYRWKNSDGSGASMIFQDDKLVVKSEFGLK